MPFLALLAGGLILYELYHYGRSQVPVFVDSLQMDTIQPYEVQSYSDGFTMINPTDRSTWPSGDRIWSVAQAIAIAEGYDALPNGLPSNAARLNNPGDISDGSKTYGAEFHSGSNVTHFPDTQTGWDWLYTKLKNIADGKSHRYSSTMTWNQIAHIWAGDYQNWVKNVTRELGVDPQSTFGDYVNG